MAALSESVRAFLAEPRFAVVATHDPDAAPQLSVIWYEMVGEEFVFSTASRNRKMRNLQRDPRLSVCVADGYRYVTLRGAVRFDDDPEAGAASVMRQAIHYLGPEQGPAMATTINTTPHVLVRVTIDEVRTYGFDSPHG